MELSQMERAVIIAALQQDITSDRKVAETTPTLKEYVERNVQFREALIAKLLNKG